MEQGRPIVDSEFDWADCYTVKELSAAVDLHAARAQKRGEYAIATELRCAAVALMDLYEQVESIKRATQMREVLVDIASTRL